MTAHGGSRRRQTLESKFTAGVGDRGHSGQVLWPRDPMEAVHRGMSSDNDWTIALIHGRLSIPRNTMNQKKVKIDDLRDRRLFDAVCRMAQSGDRLDPNLIIRSYVDMGHIDRLRTQASQYIEGRRGTGKTHLLTYFTQHINASIQDNHQIAVYIDARELLGETPETTPPARLYGQKLFQQLIALFKL